MRRYLFLFSIVFLAFVFIGTDTAFAQVYSGDTIKGLVFMDNNRNGLKESSEPLIPNATVILRDSGGNNLRATITDANPSANYSFTALAPGTYEVELIGYSVTAGCNPCTGVVVPPDVVIHFAVDPTVPTPTPVPGSTLEVELSGRVLATDPWSTIKINGDDPINDVDLQATVIGAIGKIQYEFYCTNSGAANLVPFTSTNPYVSEDLCDYTVAGAYTARVIVIDEAGRTARDFFPINVDNSLFDFDVRLEGRENLGDLWVSPELSKALPPLNNVDLRDIPTGNPGASSNGYYFDCDNDGGPIGLGDRMVPAGGLPPEVVVLDLCDYPIAGSYIARTWVTRPVAGAKIAFDSLNITVGPSSFFDITGTVYVDTNGNGVQDCPDPGPDPDICDNDPDDEQGYNNATVNLGGATSRSTTTNSLGQYSFVSLPAGNYTVTLVEPPDFTVIEPPPNPRPVTLGPDATVNFGLKPPKLLSGQVFDDTSNNNCASGATPFAAGANLTLYDGVNTVGSDTTDGIGTYSLSDPDGGRNRTAVISSISDHKVRRVRFDGGAWTTANLNAFTYGPFDLLSDHTLDWCISSLAPWFQTTTGDVRMRQLRNRVPLGKQASTELDYPSLFYSSNSTSDFGDGRASTVGWKIDDEYSYQKDSSQRNGTAAYSFYESRAKQRAVEIETLSDEISDCVPGGTCKIEGLNTGIYKVDGDLTLDGVGSDPAYVHSAGGHVVLLINGNLTIRDDFNVPVGNGNLLIIAAKGDIIIDKDVGASSVLSTTSNLQGIFMAEGDIIVEGDGCSSGTPDKRLNVAGTLVANALKPFAESGGGRVINERSLCNDDKNYPALYVSQRLDFVTQLTDFYRTSYTRWRELAP